MDTLTDPNRYPSPASLCCFTPAKPTNPSPASLTARLGGCVLVQVGELEGALKGPLQVHASSQLMCTLVAPGFKSILVEAQQCSVCISLAADALLLKLLDARLQCSQPSTYRMPWTDIDLGYQRHTAVSDGLYHLQLSFRMRLSEQKAVSTL